MSRILCYKILRRGGGLTRLILIIHREDCRISIMDSSMMMGAIRCHLGGMDYLDPQEGGRSGATTRVRIIAHMLTPMLMLTPSAARLRTRSSLTRADFSL